MLRPGGYPPKLQEWHDKLAPLVAEARQQLREMNVSKLVMRSGCTQDSDGVLRLALLWRDYQVHVPDFVIRRADTGEEPSSFQQALILSYMVTANGTTPSSRWVAFRDLPNGMFYAQAFRGYAENRLMRELGAEGLEAFRRGAEELADDPIQVGDAGYAFTVLPRIHLAAVYWLGDEDFASRTSILFEDTASHYMSTDGLAILGSHLTNAILKAARS